MNIVDPLMEAYAARYSDPEHALLKEVNDATLQQHPEAHMISGHLQGHFLQFISKLIRPKKILEIGTFSGYSALCLLEGLQPDGELHTIELREPDAIRSQQNFDRSIGADQIILHCGNALEVIPTLDHTWDLVFIDADKTGYQQYYDLVLPNLRSGGIIIADNVLFHGQVVEEPLKGKSAKAVHAFNEYESRDQRVEKMILTLRDGLMLIRKK